MYNVILFRGLAGQVYSTGLDVASLKIQKLPNVDYIIVDSYEEVDNWIKRAKNFKDQCILIGHSFGATACLKFATLLGKPVPLIITVDPSPWWWMSSALRGAGGNTVPYNVGKVINFYQPCNRLFESICNVKLEKAINFRVDTAGHTDIDDLPEIHETMLDEIGSLPR